MYSSALRTLKLQGENYSESLRFLYEKQRITKAVHLHRCDRHLIGIEAPFRRFVLPFSLSGCLLPVNESNVRLPAHLTHCGNEVATGRLLPYKSEVSGTVCSYMRVIGAPGRPFHDA